MYSNTANRIAPQVTFARKPVSVESIWSRYGYTKPIDRLFKGKADGAPDFVPG